MILTVIVLILLLAIALVVMISYKIGLLAMVLWMVENDLPQPPEEEYKALIHKVTKNLWNDLAGNRSKKP